MNDDIRFQIIKTKNKILIIYVFTILIFFYFFVWNAIKGMLNDNAIFGLTFLFILNFSCLITMHIDLKHLMLKEWIGNELKKNTEKTKGVKLEVKRNGFNIR